MPGDLMATAKPRRSRTELTLLILFAVVMVGGMALLGVINGW